MVQPCPAARSGDVSSAYIGLVEKPLTLTLADLRKFRHETQNSRMKCAQGWSSRTIWGGFRFGELAELVKPKKSVKAVRKSVLSRYSSLSTTFGSSRDARHAGSQLATTATVVIVAITMAIVTVSVG